MEKFSKQCYHALKQRRALAQLKTNLAPNSIIIHEDFSENYACKHQSEIMYAHWKTQQVTVFTAIAWYRHLDAVKSKSFVVVSDALDHNKSAVYTFNGLILAEMTNVTEFNHVHYWSDGAASQFKSKYMMNNLRYHSEDFLVTADWSFFATADGKGPVDGIGGTVKRSVYLEVIKGREIVSNYSDFLRVAKATNSTITVLSCISAKIAETEENLKEHYVQARDLPGIREQHYFFVTDGKVNGLRTCPTSNNANTSLLPPNPAAAASSSMIEFEASPSLKLWNLVAVAYEQDVWFGEIIEMVSEGEVKVKFLTAIGRKLKWPAKDMVEAVHQNHILPTKPNLAPCDNSLRAFKVINLEAVELDYATLKRKW